MPFLSTPSARRATALNVALLEVVGISIHALREEGDRAGPRRRTARRYQFLSTPSARRATQATPSRTTQLKNFYPRPPRGGRPPQPWQRWFWRIISIHALREEGDVGSRDHLVGINNFYPRPPRGGRPSGSASPSLYTVFLSTPSARRATLSASVMPKPSSSFLSTPSARRATY